MTGHVAKKQKVADSELSGFINGIEQRQVTSDQKDFTKDDVLSVSYTMSRLIGAIEKITSSPSGSQLDVLKDTSADTELVESLDDPYVSLAIKLKEAYDDGKLPIFDSLLSFKDTNPVEIQPDRVLGEFNRRASYFLPRLPEIKDAYLRQKVFSNDVSDDLVQLGGDKYRAIVSELLALRFPDLGMMNEATKYLFSHSVARTWARLFRIPISDKTDPAELFNAHFGASSLTNVTKADKDYLKAFVCILIEPIVAQLDRSYPNHSAKDELEQKGVQITYKRIHSTVYNDTAVTVVQVIAGGEDCSVLLGFASAATEVYAQVKAAACVTQDPSQLTRLLSNLRQLEQSVYKGNPPGVPAVTHAPFPPVLAAPGVVAPFPPVAAAVAPGPATRTPVQQPYGAIVPHQQSLYSQQPQGQQPVYGNAQLPQIGYGQQGYSQSAHSHSPEPSTALVRATVASTAMVPVALSTSALENPFIDAYLVTDIAENDIDNNSKASLNRLLIDNRYDAAEYKTTKLNNSDVQVTCIIGGKPITRAISTNKKRAGQMCAQCILKYEDYFFTEHIPPPR